MLYRVCLPVDVDPAWEDIPFPGNSNRLTGFWTPHLECAKSILKGREQHQEHAHGAGTYAKIYTVRKQDAITGCLGRKTGHNNKYDRDEVFVIGFLTQPELYK